jgi:hypothetical protein
MKKTFGVLFSLVVILSLVGTVFAASGPPGSGWYTGITLQNVGTRSAMVEIIAYGADGSSATASTTILQNASKNLLPNDFVGMGASFQGGAIVSSDVELASIVNVTNRYISSLNLGDPAANAHPAAAQYQGMSMPSSTLLFPLIKNKSFNKSTVVYIQNAGPAAGTATATFLLRTQETAPFVTYTYTTPSLQVGQTAVFSAADARNGTTPPPDGAIGSLTVTSGQTMAGAFLEHQSNVSVATLLQSTRAFTPNDADSVLYSPTNKDAYFNRFTGLQVQNIGPGDVSVRVTYTVAGGPAGCTVGATANETRAIVMNASVTFASTVIPGNGCLASAKAQVVSGSGKIVGVVNESYTAAFVSTGKYQESVTSFAFPGKMATTRVSVPVYKEDSFNKGTGVNIQNVGNVNATNVVITLTMANGTQFRTNPFTINAGAARAFSDMRNINTANFWNGTPMTPAALGCTSGNTVCGANGALSMIITADQPIVVIANESTYPFSNPRIQQDKNNYEGFNLP